MWKLLLAACVVAAGVAHLPLPARGEEIVQVHELHQPAEANVRNAACGADC